MGETAPEKLNLLIAVTGSVATIKLGEIVDQLCPIYNIRVIATNEACHFLPSSLPGNVQVLHDADEYANWHQVGDEVLHIELRRWAHGLLVAPLSSNTLAKMAVGICDNLVTTVIKAWNLSNPIIVAPAMNTYMWDNPLTAKHLETIQEIYNAKLLPTQVKLLACGDYGDGAMASVEEIVTQTREIVRKMAD